MAKKSVSLSKQIYSFWNKLPSAIKIIVYVFIGALLQQLAVDVAGLPVEELGRLEPYANILIIALGDVLIYSAERFIAKSANLVE